jgi:hypothetical protein
VTRPGHGLRGGGCMGWTSFARWTPATSECRRRHQETELPTYDALAATSMEPVAWESNPGPHDYKAWVAHSADCRPDVLSRLVRQQLRDRADRSAHSGHPRRPRLCDAVTVDRSRPSIWVSQVSHHDLGVDSLEHETLDAQIVDTESAVSM